MKFTNRSIQSLKSKSERYEVWEDNGKGFGLRISLAGRKSCLFMYRFNGRARRMTLGNYPKTSLADAHEAHATARKQLEKGIDPGKIKVQANQEERESLTVQQLSPEALKVLEEIQSAEYRIRVAFPLPVSRQAGYTRQHKPCIIQESRQTENRALHSARFTPDSRQSDDCYGYFPAGGIQDTQSC